MNFLSHYYFDKTKTDAYEVLGMVLPDLLKNADKTWNAHPEKNEKLFIHHPQHLAILTGWKRHLEVDRLFHDSTFFKHHQHQIKLQIRESIKSSQVKPFFLAHISLELMLDSLLLSKELIKVEHFYHLLNSVDRSILSDFLKINGITNINRFFHFYDSFIKEKYLFSYINTEKITYALRRICMRLWEEPFTLEQETALTSCLLNYKKNLSEEFIFIFDTIDAQIN
ncbi:MAG: hypothetical protein IE931_01870 [Sphingobacteriales bacterium]|nr:hypothetical protein [Sphingobacteriales bacterium]